MSQLFKFTNVVVFSSRNVLKDVMFDSRMKSCPRLLQFIQSVLMKAHFTIQGRSSITAVSIYKKPCSGKKSSTVNMGFRTVIIAEINIVYGTSMHFYTYIHSRYMCAS
jgi:hypothetical protein